MKELGDALKAIFDKVGGFLDLFDLSFFISGAAALAAGALFYFQYLHWPVPVLDGWISVTLIIVATYVSGMVCFAAGRCVRQLVTKTRSSPTFLGGVGCGCLCGREAGRYTLHQVVELAATLAAAQKAK